VRSHRISKYDFVNNPSMCASAKADSRSRTRSLSRLNSPGSSGLSTRTTFLSKSLFPYCLTHLLTVS